MARKTWIKISGTWKPLVQIWRKVSGAWQSGVISWRKIGSDWKQCMEYPPATPTGLGVSQPVMGDDMHVVWDTVADATYYKLYRKPYWDGDSWVEDYELQYNGANNTYDDPIQDEQPPDDGTTIYYKVLAGNAVGESPLSAAASGIWFAM